MLLTSVSSVLSVLSVPSEWTISGAVSVEMGSEITTKGYCDFTLNWNTKGK